MEPPCVGQPMFTVEVNVGWDRWPMCVCVMECGVLGAPDPAVRAKEGRIRGLPAIVGVECEG
jgi:hypothetical protein